MMNSILQNLKENQDDTNLRTVVLAAEGPIYSAGHNLKELVNLYTFLLLLLSVMVLF